MTETEKYRLSLYETVRVLRSTEEVQILLVTNSLNGNPYIKKIYHADKRAAFERLLSVKCHNLPEIVELFFSEDTIVIEQYVPGKTLSKLLDMGIGFTNRDILCMAEDLALALCALHEKGVIHRDIKPDNIILTPNGTAVLIDFGIARCYAGNQRNDTTCFGTKGYAAPEQYGFSQSDFRSDIYALGITLDEIARQGNVSRGIRCLIDDCSAFDPGQRIPSAEELLYRLKRLKTGPRRLCLSAAAAVAAALFAIGGWTVWNHVRTGGMDMAGEKIDSSGIRLVLTDSDEIPVRAARVSENEVRSYHGALSSDRGAEEIGLEAEYRDRTMYLRINHEDVFQLTYPEDDSPKSYSGSSMTGEILFYDLNRDGRDEIIPLMADAVLVDAGNGEEDVLPNGITGWCIYLAEDGTFQLADGEIRAELQLLKIYEAAPGILWGDNLQKFYLEDGVLKTGTL